MSQIDIFDEIICPACPHYDIGVYGSGTAACYQNLMLEAADTIESQQKRIAELEAALREQEERRWIPVTERRPNGECLAISMLPGPTYKEKLVGWIQRAEEWETGYVCESEGVILPNVTHWMQPELPKGATDGKG